MMCFIRSLQVVAERMFWRFRPLPVFLLVAVFCADTAVAEGERLTYERVGEQDICGGRNCDDLPIGYHTVEFADRQYYFPIRELTLPDWEEQKDQVGEIINGSMVREYGSGWAGWPYVGLQHSYALEGRVQFRGCCTELFNWYKLDIPYAKYEEGTVYLDPYRARRSTRIYDGSSLYYRAFNELPKPGKEISPPQLPDEFRQPFSASFWLFSTDEKSFELVSREPLLDGQYIIIDCLEHCKFKSLRPVAGATRPAFVFSLTVLNFLWVYGATSEEKRSFKSNRTVNETVQMQFESFAETIRQFDKMLHLASRHPERKTNALSPDFTETIGLIRDVLDVIDANDALELRGFLDEETQFGTRLSASPKKFRNIGYTPRRYRNSIIGGVF